MDYLVMRLYAPLSSWGTVAVGEDRPTASHPTRGAILGLLGAALGIKRSESKKLQDLSSSIALASKTYSEGTILRDYHTIQTPTASKGANFYTRKQELQSSKVETILSSRDYREDGLWVVAIWLRPSKKLSNLTHHFDLPTLQQALINPKFTLYIGRKSCPLALPLSPKIITADSIQSALDIDMETLISSDKPNQSPKCAEKPDWRINELLEKIVSDRYLPTAIEYSSSPDQSEERSRYRIVTYHWEGTKKQLFEISGDHSSSDNVKNSDSGKLPTNIFTHNHWDEPMNRKQWQFTQRVGHEWSTREIIEPTKSVDNASTPISSSLRDSANLPSASATDGVL